jgi:hypothetical protein
MSSLRAATAVSLVQKYDRQLYSCVVVVVVGVVVISAISPKIRKILLRELPSHFAHSQRAR